MKKTLGLTDVIAMMYGKNYELSNYAYVKISTVPHDAPYVVQPLKELFAAMLKIGRFNFFIPAKVIEYLTKAVKANDICEIRFGREYSPAMYLTVSMLNKRHERLTDAIFAAKKERVLAEIKKAIGPDEVWFTGKDTAEIRCWWD
jgi:hypothetical protein